jgi:hypothetical protein
VASPASAKSVPNYVGTQRVSTTSNLGKLFREPQVFKLSPSKVYANKAPAWAPTEPRNPFEEDNYDDAKNPFAVEEPTNPFGDDDEDDYNDSLNPLTE